MTTSPYADLDPRAYWRSGVAGAHMAQADQMDLYRPKFPIRATDSVATAGSCFAQHIARNMRGWGLNVLDTEPAPFGLPPQMHADYGYGLYSARHGNIYTTRQLLQLFQESMGRFTPRNWIWEKDGRYYDALRPSVDPRGLETPELVTLSRRSHLRKFRRAMSQADLVVFTLGLTETWEDIDSGTVYPTAPGTIAGAHDPEQVRFRNLTHAEVLHDFVEFRRLLKKVNPGVRFLLTVSPVPLTATASGQHVLCATTYSKSVLRAVTGQLYDSYGDVDYFPSYEIITAPSARGFFYAPNMRSVLPEAVEVVMKAFRTAHAQTLGTGTDTGTAAPPPVPATAGAGAQDPGRAAMPEAEDVKCEDVLLEAFAR